MEVITAFIIWNFQNPSRWTKKYYFLFNITWHCLLWTAFPKINKNNTKKSFSRWSNYTWSYCSWVLWKNSFMEFFTFFKITQRKEGDFFHIHMSWFLGLIFQILCSNPAFCVQQRQESRAGAQHKALLSPPGTDTPKSAQGALGITPCAAKPQQSIRDLVDLWHQIMNK